MGKGLCMAYTNKQLSLIVLKILKEETDYDHRLTYKELKGILIGQYGFSEKLDNKTLRGAVRDLKEVGYDIDGDKTVRVVRGEEQEVNTNLYLAHDFEEAEVRLLLDSILFSRHIDSAQRKYLEKKIIGLTSCHFKAKVKHIDTLTTTMKGNAELFNNIEVLEDAIATKKQVALLYNQYDLDKKLHPVKAHKYIINPYQMAVVQGQYYLIGNVDKYDDMYHYRVDRMTDIEILEQSAKPLRRVKGYENGETINLSKHLADNIYMLAGKGERVEFLANREMVGTIIDWFGLDVNFTELADDQIKVIVTVNPRAMRYWLLQYLSSVQVIGPQSLVDEVREDLEKGLAKYKH